MGSLTPTRRRIHRFGALTAVVGVLALGVSACIPPAESGAPFLLRGLYAGGLDHAWDLAFLPNGVGIYTENDSGQISARLSATDTHHVLGGVPVSENFNPSGEGGLMGIAVDPNWSVNQFVYVCYSTNTDNRVARLTLNPASNPSVANWTPIVTGIPHNSFHDGCRVRFRPGSTDELFVSTGDAGQPTVPQDDASLGGKVLRIQTPNGTAYPGNPGGHLWYTKGHRNPQGIAFRPGTNQVFDDEHGPDVNDEVNLLQPGGNAGWNPNVNNQYNQSVPMTDASLDTVANPIINATWSSGGVTVAPSGSTFLSGSQWKNWDGALVVACLDGSPDVGQRLLVMHLNAAGDGLLPGSPVTAMAFGVRLRSVVEGPDGNLYVVTDGTGGAGEIWQVNPI
jgi:glucose/arabinose dehydrogenase